MEASRKISIKEYMKVLQLEYLSFSLRGMIFDKAPQIKMSKDIAEKKKEKIQNLSERFALESVFSSEESFNSFVEKEFICEFGLPKIQYSIQEDKRKSQEYWDSFYLLKKGTLVYYQNKPYQVKENYPLDKNVLLENDILVPYTYVQLKYLSNIFRYLSNKVLNNKN